MTGDGSDVFREALDFISEYVSDDKEAETVLLSSFADSLFYDIKYKDRRLDYLKATVQKMARRNRDTIIKYIAENVFSFNYFNTCFGSDRHDIDGDDWIKPIKFFAGLLRDDTINISMLGRTNLHYWQACTNGYDILGRILYTLHIDPENRRYLYAFQCKLICIDNEDIIIDMIRLKLLGKGNMHKAIAYARKKKCFRVIPIMISEISRTNNISSIYEGGLHDEGMSFE